MSFVTRVNLSLSRSGVLVVYIFQPQVRKGTNGRSDTLYVSQFGFTRSGAVSSLDLDPSPPPTNSLLDLSTTVAVAVGGDAGGVDVESFQRRPKPRLKGTVSDPLLWPNEVNQVLACTINSRMVYDFRCLNTGNMIETFAADCLLWYHYWHCGPHILRAQYCALLAYSGCPPPPMVQMLNFDAISSWNEIALKTAVWDECGVKRLRC